MEDLPPPLLIDILSRLNDSTELARCRLTSKTLRALSYDVRSVNLVCSHDRFLRSRAPETRNGTVPFKSLVVNLLSLLSAGVQSLFLGIERPFVTDAWVDDEFDDSDDLHLTAVDFVSRWLPLVGGRLRSLSISDYWIQSCWRRSDALSLISDSCGNLLDLMVRNAWLSVEGLRPMLKLTTLTLEFIRLDDEDLNKVNSCFPSLQILKLLGVGGLKEPKIHLSQLRVCHWTVSSFPLSLTINAPNLLELKLSCSEPNTLVLDTPVLSHLDLKIKKPGRVIKVERFLNLKSLRLDSSYLHQLINVFKDYKTVNKLELKGPKYVGPDGLLENFTIMDLVTSFPSTDDLNLGPYAWAELEKSFICKGVGIEGQWRNLKKLMVHLPLAFDISFLTFMLNLCSPFCKVALLFHGDAFTADSNHTISTCKGNFPNVRWEWGVWREFHEDEFFHL